MPELSNIKDLYIPLATALTSLIAVCVAFASLYLARKDRAEQQKEVAREKLERNKEKEFEIKERIERQKEAKMEAIRREQDALFNALHGEKETIGFMALQLARQPELITEDNRERLISALCLAFVFQKSSRARALVLHALNTFSKDAQLKEWTGAIFDDLIIIFRDYEQEMEANELNKYRNRINQIRTLFNLTED